MTGRLRRALGVKEREDLFRRRKDVVGSACLDSDGHVESA